MYLLHIATELVQVDAEFPAVLSLVTQLIHLLLLLPKNLQPLPHWLKRSGVIHWWPCLFCCCHGSIQTNHEPLTAGKSHLRHFSNLCSLRLKVLEPGFYVSWSTIELFLRDITAYLLEISSKLRERKIDKLTHHTYDIYHVMEKFLTIVQCLIQLDTTHCFKANLDLVMDELFLINLTGIMSACPSLIAS